MANLSETADWEVGVYQIETTDPVLGGAPNVGTGAGMTNIPHLQLAKRTAWLKGQVDQLLLDLAAAGSGLALKANIANPTFTGNPTGPTPDQFDNDASLATTAFVQRALGNYRGAETVSAGFTILPADAGKAYICGLSTAITITLPSIAATAIGASFLIINTGTANVTVQRAGSDTIDNGPDAATSIVIPPNASLQFLRVAGTLLWHLVMPSAAPNRSYRSSPVTIANSGLYNFSHGLAQIPNGVSLWLRCVTAEHGYSVGDVILTRAGADPDGIVEGVAVYVTSTTISCRIGSNGPTEYVRKDSGAGVTGITAANWQLEVAAWL